MGEKDKGKTFRKNFCQKFKKVELLILLSEKRCHSRKSEKLLFSFCKSKREHKDLLKNKNCKALRLWLQIVNNK